MTLMTVLAVTALVALALHLLNTHGPLKPEVNKPVSMVVATAMLLVLLVWSLLALVARFG